MRLRDRYGTQPAQGDWQGTVRLPTPDPSATGVHGQRFMAAGTAGLVRTEDTDAKVAGSGLITARL